MAKAPADPSDLRERFLAVSSRAELASLLEVSDARLIWHAYRSAPGKRYRTFSIPRKAGGVRTIQSPLPALKELQRRIANVLEAAYRPRGCVTGFVSGRSIVDNAEMHTGRRWILNLDLEGFFPSIHFGRIRGLLLAGPYSLPESVATIIAQLCCNSGRLPQGAPTSPVVANMICAKMDSELTRLAHDLQAVYSRYADDITFSSWLPLMPKDLAMAENPSLGGIAELGLPLTQVIESNGFNINPTKTRLERWSRRQVVTGLVVNPRLNVKRKYVRQVRAMLHAWQRWGHDAAQAEYFSKGYDRRAGSRSPFKPLPRFRDVVLGKLGV